MRNLPVARWDSHRRQRGAEARRTGSVCAASRPAALAASSSDSPLFRHVRDLRTSLRPPITVRPHYPCGCNNQPVCGFLPRLGSSRCAGAYVQHGHPPFGPTGGSHCMQIHHEPPSDSRDCSSWKLTDRWCVHLGNRLRRNKVRDVQ